MPEGGEGQHPDAWLIAKPTRSPCRLDGDLGQLLRRWHLGDGGVRHQHGAPARQHDRQANQPVARLFINDAADIFECNRIVPRHAGDHGVRIAQLDHGGGKMVAVLVDHPLAITEQVAMPLQALIEKLRIGGVAVRQPRIVDLDVLAFEIDAKKSGRFGDAVFATHKDGAAKPLVHKGHGSADDLLFLALGKDHALGIAPHPLDDAVQRAGHRVPARRKLCLVGHHVDNRLAGHACVHRSLRHRCGDNMDQARVERHRDDILAAITRACPLIGRGHLVRNIFTRQISQRMGSRDLHFHVDGRGAHIQRAPEDVGEAQHIVDLVGIVRAAGGHDRVVADGSHFFRRDFRVRIRHGKDDRVWRHRAHHLGGHRALLGQAEEGIGARHRLGQRAPVGLGGMSRLPLVHAFHAALPDHALRVAENDIVRLEAHRLQQFRTGNGGGARAIHHQPR